MIAKRLQPVYNTGEELRSKWLDSKGIWKLEGSNNGKTNVFISADFDWGIPKLEKFIGHILEKKARRSLRGMLNAITKKLSNG